MSNNNKETINLYLSIHCNINGSVMSYSYLAVNSAGEFIFETTNHYPARFDNSLIACFNLALNDLDFDLIFNFFTGQNLPDSINFICNFQQVNDIFNGYIIVDDKYSNIKKFIETKKRFEGEFCQFNTVFSNSDETIIDLEYKSISAALYSLESKDFYKYTLAEFKAMAKNDRPAFIEMIKANKWNEIRVNKDQLQLDKIAYIQQVFNVGKKEMIRRTLDLFGGVSRHKCSTHN